MKTTWIKGVTDTQVLEDIKTAFQSSYVLRKRLAEILEDKSKEKERSDMNVDGYDCPNWSYKMADSQGYKRAISEIISLITEK